MFEIELTVAGVPFRVEVEGPCDPAHVEARFGAYRSALQATPALSPEATVRITATPGWKPPREPRVPFPGAEGEALADGTVRFLRSSEEVTWDPRARRAEVTCLHVAQRHPPMVDPTAVDTPLRLVLSHDLPARDGLLVHACGYGDARGAVVFLAPTGGGKTTTSRKLPHASVLSDDQVALRRVDGAWRAFALPFVGDYGRATVPRVAPLRALVLLEKSSAATLTRATGARTLARVMHCVVRFVRGDDGGRLLALSADLVASVPVYALAIPREEPVMPFVEGLLG